MITNQLSRILRISSVCLLFFTAVNAIIAGVLFMVDITGEKMGMSVTYLSHSPFHTYFIPGIILFIVNGLLNIVAGVAVLRKYKYYRGLLIFQGVALSGWIIIQVFMVRDFNKLHLVMLSIGLLLVILGVILKKAN